MFGKSDFADSLSRDLARARAKRDSLASDVVALTAQITELEASLSAENERRERKRAASEIERVKKRVKDQYLAFAPVIAGMRDAIELTAAIVPEARELDKFLLVIATEVANSIDSLLDDLDRRLEPLRADDAAPPLPESLNGSPELPQNSDGVLRLPEWLPRREPTTKESVEDRCSTAAA